MSDEGDKNHVGNIIIGGAELKYLIQCLDLHSCAAHRMKALGHKIENNTKRGKYFSVDKILKDNMIILGREIKLTTNKEKYGITTVINVECKKLRTTVTEVQPQIFTSYLH